MTDRLATVDYVRHLTRHHHEIQTPTPDTPGHIVMAPPLLEQLAASDIPSRAAGGDTVPGYESKPAARLDAIDALRDVTGGSAGWVTSLGQKPRNNPIGLVLQLHGLLPQADPTQRAAIEADIRHWWTLARIVTGWDSPPWTPDNTCPACGALRSLRIRLADRLGLCTECRVSWNAGTIGLLADHIRAESAERAAAREAGGVGRSPCWCAVPKPVVPDLSSTCPSCGSARCHHAVAARELAAVRRRLAATG